MPRWTDVIDETALPEGSVLAVAAPFAAGPREIALYRVDGRVFATDNVCTHADARLCDGFLIGHEIECPLHQARFDVRDGRVTCEPAIEPVATWPVRIDGGRVWVEID